MRKISFVSIIIFVLCFSFAFANSFTDLDSSHWAYEPINDMMIRGVLKGYPDGTFRPDASITRAEFAKILVSALNLEEDTNTKNIVFEDVPDTYWAKDYIRIASQYLSAYNTGDGRLFYKPDEKAAREDVTVAMVISLGLQNEGYSFANLSKFSDKDTISSNLKKYVAIAVENKLINGFDDGTFKPKDTLTRAQVSQLIKNASDAFGIEIAKPNDKDMVLKFNSDDLTIDLGENFENYTFSAYSGFPYQPSQRVLVYNGYYENGKKITSQKSSVPNIDIYGSREFYSYIGNESSSDNKSVIIIDTKTNDIHTILVPNPFKVTVKIDEKEIYSSYADMYGDTPEKKTQGYYMPVLAGQKVKVNFDLLNGLKYAEISINPYQSNEQKFVTYDSNYEFNIPDFTLRDTGSIMIKMVDKKDNYDVVRYNYVNKKIIDLKYDFYTLVWCQIMKDGEIDLYKDSSTPINYKIANYCRIPRTLYSKTFDFNNPKSMNKLVWVGLDSNNEVGAIIPVNDSMHKGQVYNGSYYNGPSITELKADFEFKDFNGKYAYSIFDDDNANPIDLSDAKIYSAIEGKRWGKVVFPNERWGFYYNIKSKLAYAISNKDGSKVERVYLIALAEDGAKHDMNYLNNNSQKTPIIDLDSNNNSKDELFSDIKYDYKTGTLDMGNNFSQYLYTWSYDLTVDKAELLKNIQKRYSPCYTPSQRILNYYHGLNDEGKMIGGAGNTRYGGYYIMVANKNDISQTKFIDLSKYSIGGDIHFNPNEDVLLINNLDKYLIAPGKIVGDSYIPDGKFVEPSSTHLTRGVEVTPTTFAGDYIVVALKSNPNATKLFHTKEISQLSITSSNINNRITPKDTIEIRFSRNIDKLDSLDIGILYNNSGYPINDLVTIKDNKITIKGSELFKQLEKRPIGTFDSNGELKNTTLSIGIIYDEAGIGYYGKSYLFTLAK